MTARAGAAVIRGGRWWDYLALFAMVASWWGMALNPDLHEMLLAWWREIAAVI